jgi:sodium-dependent phosphate cotransporter
VPFGKMTPPEIIEPGLVPEELASQEAPDPIGEPVAESSQENAPQSRLGALWRRVAWAKIILFIFSLLLFILALMLMKEGAKGLAPLLDGRGLISSPANSLGFGWIFAYTVMSGSPVAASALTFLDAGILNQMSAFTMISGSRLGSSLIVLIIGFLYVLRGRDRATSLGAGLLSFTVTGSLHAGVLLFGLVVLRNPRLQLMPAGDGMLLNSLTGAFLDPIVSFAAARLPAWGLFLIGLLIILASFNLFDRCLPQLALQESQFGRVARLVYRPSVMFLLGAAVTLISMSVSVSLTLLVPLSQRGFVRRENFVPYIMGANVTTFVDTLFAAFMLSNPAAVSVVATQMAGVGLISAIILLFFFRAYERLLLASSAWVTASNRHIAYFMIAIITIPIVLVLL